MAARGGHVGGLAVNILADVCPDLVRRAACSHCLGPMLTLAGSSYLYSVSISTPDIGRPRIACCTP